MPVLGFLRRRLLGRVELIGDLAHDFFENVLKRDQPLQRAIFIHHQRKMAAHAQELAHLFIQRCGFRHEIGRLGDRDDLEIAQCGRIAVRPADLGVHVAQQILGMDHADDVLRFILENRQAGMG